MANSNFLCKTIAVESKHSTNNKFRFESVEIKADTLEEQIEEDKQFGKFPISSSDTLTYRLINHSSDFDKKKQKPNWYELCLDSMGH